MGYHLILVRVAKINITGNNRCSLFVSVYVMSHFTENNCWAVRKDKINKIQSPALRNSQSKFSRILVSSQLEAELHFENN